MSLRLIVTVPAALACAAMLLPASGQASGHAQTLRFFDKPVAMKLTRAGGTVITHPPFPQAKAGDILEVDSLDYAGNHIRHAKASSGRTHLRCVFRAGPPKCESHVRFGGSVLVFTGNPGTVARGTGIYRGATGRVILLKEIPGSDASDVVARIQLKTAP